MNRRAFFSWLGRVGKASVAGAVGLSASLRLRAGFARAESAPPGQFPVRPPGALPEKEFLAACIRCYLCGEICPVDCIAFPDRIEGAQPPLLRAPGALDRPETIAPVWIADETPFILPWEKGCAIVGCMQCGKICPTGALRPLANDRETIGREVRMGIAHIDRKICLPWTRTSWCGACLTACPWRGHAITVDYQGRPTIHAESCTGCAICVEVCPIRYKAIAVKPPFASDHGEVRAE